MKLRKTRRKRGGRKWVEEIIPRTLPELVRKLKDMEGVLVRISDDVPDDSDPHYRGEVGILRNVIKHKMEVHVELESETSGGRWWANFKYPGTPFKVEVVSTPHFAPAAGGGKSTTRRKRRKRRTRRRTHRRTHRRTRKRRTHKRRTRKRRTHRRRRRY